MTPIESALALVLADLTATGAPLPRVDWEPWQPADHSKSSTLYAADGSGMGVWLDLDLPEAEALAHLADQVQEWLVEELCRQRRPTNWPACPAHPGTHPQAPVVEAGRAVWICPRGESTPVPVGQLRLPG